MRFIILDTETTGQEEEDRVCQLSYLITERNGRISEVHDSLCKPPLPIKFSAMAVHHITSEAIENKPPLQETPAWARLQALNTEEKRNPIAMVIHNAPFDLEMLQKEGYKSHLPLIDTLRCLRHLYPDMESHGLQYARYAFGLYKGEKEEVVPLGIKIRPHDALGDVVVLKLLLDKLLEENSPEDLINLTRQPIGYKTFRFGKYKGESVEEIAAKDPGYIDWMLKPKDGQSELDDDWRFTLEKALEKTAGSASYTFPFGKYKGRTPKEVAQTDIGYLRWCLDKMDRISDGLRKAIEDAVAVCG